MLSTGFADSSLSPDLVTQVHLEELLLLLMRIQVSLYLVQCLLWAEVGLVVERLNLAVLVFNPALLLDLAL